MATWPPEIVVELFYDKVWNDITPDVRLTSDLKMTLGIRDEGADAADPGKMTLTLNNGRSRVNPNVSGRYSPKNPRSDLFGKIGKNSPIRVRVVEDGTTAIFDNFGRVVTGGWGVADSGEAWQLIGSAADFEVDGSFGFVTQPTPGIAHLALIPAADADSEITSFVATTALASGDSLFGGLLLRAVDNQDFYTARVEFTTLAEVKLSLRKRVAGVETELATFTAAFSHAAGRFYQVRFRVNGSILQARVWDPEDPEPGGWQVQALDADLTATASLGTRSFSGASNTNVNPIIAYDVLRAEVVSEPEPFLFDTFERTVSPGWGTADTGQTWFIQETFDNGVNDTDYSVSGGLGNMLMDVNNPEQFRMIQTTLDEPKADLDVTCSMQTDKRSVASSGLRAVFGTVCVRVNSDASRLVAAAVWFAADGGLPNGQGLRVATSIIASVNFRNVEEVQGTIVPDLVYAPGVPLFVRVRVVGPEFRMRVWSSDQPEPVVWHSQAHIESVPEAGDFAILTQDNTNGTDLPVTVSFNDLSVSDPPTADETVRGVFEVYEWPSRWDISDSDQWVPITTNGILRRLRQGAQPIRSALRRYIASVFPVAYWPLEDRGFFGRFGVEAVAGGESLAVAGVKFQADDEVPGSEPLPELRKPTGGPTSSDALSFMKSDNVPAVDTGTWSAWMLVRLPTDDFPTSGRHDLFKVYSTGTGVAWLISAEIFSGDSSPALRGRIFDEDSNVIGEAVASEGAALGGGGPRLTDEWRLVCWRVNQQDATTVNWRFDWFTLNGQFNWGNGGSFTGEAGHFARVDTNFSPDLAGMKFGHVSAWGVRDPVGYFDRLTDLHATLGFIGEEARERARRVAVEENTFILVEGNADTPMGSQSVATINDLITDANTADIGILTEQRAASGLLFRARELLYNQDPALVLDYSNGEIFVPFEPTDDDQQVNNSVTASRQGGASATAVQRTGPVNIQSPVTDPDGIGEYTQTFNVNVESDDQLPDYAGWRLHLGTVDELRYPKVTINLANERIRPFIDQLTQIREGDKITIINPPDWLPADDIQLLVKGYDETLNAFTWQLSFVCAPASPWTIAEVAPSAEIIEGFEDPTFSFQFDDGGDVPWARDMTESLSGDWSMKSGDITDNQTSDLILDLPPGAQRLTFWYMTSSEQSGTGFEGDRLLVLGDISGQVLRAQGTVDWTQFIMDVSQDSTVTFRYIKDNSVSVGEDAAWIDKVSVRVLTGAGTDEPNRADTTKSVLRFSRDAPDTTLFVNTVFDSEDATAPAAQWVNSAAPGWPGAGSPGLELTTAFPDEFPFDVRLSPRGGSSGEVVQVDEIEPWGWDSFTRTETNQWGDLDSGETWAPAGGMASDRSVNGSAGVITLQANPSQIRFQQLLNNIEDCEILLTMSPQQTSTGDALIPGVLLRAFGNYYRARVHFNTDGSMSTSIVRVTTLVGSTQPLPWAYGPNDVFWVRVRIVGQRVLMRVWHDGDAEPGVWYNDQTVTNSPIPTGAVGVTCSTFGGNTNVNPSITYDNFQVVTPQKFTVQRGVNDVQLDQPQGTDVRLAQPAIVAL